MENDPDKLIQNQSPAPEPQPQVPASQPQPIVIAPTTPPATPNSLQPVVTPTVEQQPIVPEQPPIPDQTPTPSQQPIQYPQEAGPKLKLTNFAIVGFGGSITLAIFLPNSRFAQLLFIPILISGVAGALIFINESIRASKKSNIAAKFVLIFGGLGVGVVIFIITVIAAFVVDGAKDPHPPPPS